MKKFWSMLLVVLILLMVGGCANTADLPPDIPSTEPTEETLPRFLDENGDGKVNWFALGDSITQGYYSHLKDGTGTLAFDAKSGWAQHVANATGWTLVNSAVGGFGYVHMGTVLDKLSGRDHIDNIDFIAAELVTLAFGINDWKGDQKLGSMDDDIATGGTFYSNMRYCIEKILKDNPDVEIVVISPMNSCRFGLAEKNWSLGYKFYKSGTLQDVFDAMQEICAYYKIPLIDLTHNEEINGDIQNWFPDGVHPSLEKHVRLAQILEEELK
jgi:lysophospholipase L1-like esterase